jgi:hypothetical protein
MTEKFRNPVIRRKARQRDNRSGYNPMGQVFPSSKQEMLEPTFACHLIPFPAFERRESSPPSTLNA